MPCDPPRNSSIHFAIVFLIAGIAAMKSYDIAMRERTACPAARRFADADVVWERKAV
jgi:hypothetical protein